MKLQIFRAGEGAGRPAVVLLHGFPENARSWRKQFGPLVESGYSVLAPDLRGYGGSDRPRGRAAYRLRHLVQDVASVVRASGAGRAHVVGHDWGGIIAWAFAGSHPELLDRLVILNAPHMGIFGEKVWRTSQFFRSWYVGFFQLPLVPEWAIAARDFAALRRVFRKTPARTGAFTDKDVEVYVEAMRRPGALTAAINYYRANMRPGAMAPARSARTEAPTLVIWGKRDPALSVRLLDGLERFAPRVRVHRLPDAGHWIQNEAPAEVSRLLVEFLRGN